MFLTLAVAATVTTAFALNVGTPCDDPLVQKYGLFNGVEYPANSLGVEYTCVIPPNTPFTCRYYYDGETRVFCPDPGRFVPKISPLK